MADIDFPSTLRGAIQSTKSTAQAAGFNESSPAAGASYTQAFTTDQPTFINFDLKFNVSQSIHFDAWARANKIFNSGLYFNMIFGDEYGVNTQEVRFVSGGVPTMAQNGFVTNYQGCQVICKVYSKPDADFVVSFFEVYGGDLDQLSQLDIMINQNWPQV
jgi:hypothetical protein